MKIVTFPIGVRSTTPKLGLTAVPIISSILSQSIKEPYILALNTLDSYKKNREQFIIPYLDELKNQNVNYDEIWVDSNNITMEKLKGIIVTHFDNGFLKNEERNIYICSCGKVEFLDTGHLNKKARLYKVLDSSIQCNECGEIINSKKKNV